MQNDSIEDIKVLNRNLNTQSTKVMLVNRSLEQLPGIRRGGRYSPYLEETSEIQRDESYLETSMVEETAEEVYSSVYESSENEIAEEGDLKKFERQVL